MTAAPRISPGARADIGRRNALVVRVLGAATGGRPANLFPTLARHRRLFLPWLRFAGRLMPGGLLPRADSELLILRVAHNCASAYEWSHHEHIGRQAGLSAEEIERVRQGPDAPGWTKRQATLLRAADELHREHTISDATWAGLRGLGLSDAELIELCMLVGHYTMLAGTLNALGVQPDPAPLGGGSRAFRLLERIRRRRGGGAR